MLYVTMSVFKISQHFVTLIKYVLVLTTLHEIAIVLSSV